MLCHQEALFDLSSVAGLNTLFISYRDKDKGGSGCRRPEEKENRARQPNLDTTPGVSDLEPKLDTTPGGLDVLEFSEDDYKRLMRSRGPVEPKELEKTRRLELESLGGMHLNYYKSSWADPYQRTIDFAQAVAAALEKFHGGPVLGPGLILDAPLDGPIDAVDLKTWRTMVKGRCLADRNGARYDEWATAVVERYEARPLANNGTVGVGHFASTNATKAYLGWLEAQGRDEHPAFPAILKEPLWSKDEHDLDDPAQLAYFQRAHAAIEKSTPKRGGVTVPMAIAEAIEKGILPRGWYLEHMPDLVEKIDKALEQRELDRQEYARLFESHATPAPKPVSEPEPAPLPECFGQFEESPEQCSNCVAKNEAGHDCEVVYLRAQRAAKKAREAAALNQKPFAREALAGV